MRLAPFWDISNHVTLPAFSLLKQVGLHQREDDKFSFNCILLWQSYILGSLDVHKGTLLVWYDGRRRYLACYNNITIIIIRD
jgi:hypothetical protein